MDLAEIERQLARVENALARQEEIVAELVEMRSPHLVADAEDVLRRFQHLKEGLIPDRKRLREEIEVARRAEPRWCPTVNT